MTRRPNALVAALLGIAVTLSTITGLPMAAAAQPRMVADPPAFSDVADSPFADDIAWMVEQGITSGYPDGTFRPTAPVTRQAFAAFLFRMQGQTGGGACASGVAPFSDVPASAAFCGEITWLASTGITSGYGDGTFRPTAAVSRQAIAAFLYRVDHSSDTAVNAEGACSSESPFSDIDSESTFCEVIRWMSSMGPEPITTGYPDGTFRATASASRGAIAAWLHRYRIDVPAEGHALDYEVAAATVEVDPADVEEVVPVVTEAPDADGDEIPDAAPEVTSEVTLASGSEIPEVGAGFVVPPGTSEVETGMAGVVTDVTTLPDGTVGVTVESAPLDEIFDELVMEYDGPIDLSGAPPLEYADPPESAALASSPIPAALSLSPASIAERVQPGSASRVAAAASAPINCTREDGSVVSGAVGVSFGLTFENFKAHYEVDLGGPFRDPFIAVWVSFEPVVSLSFSVSASVKCSLKLPKFTAPIPALPAITISVGPFVDFKVKGAAAFSIKQRMYKTVGFTSDGSGGFNAISSGSSDAVKYTASGSVALELSAGAEIEVGVLDRVGLYVKAGPTLKFSATATAAVSANSVDKMCISFTGSLDASIGAYVDVWVARWTFEFGKFSLQLLSLSKCTPEDPPPGTTGITSASPLRVPPSGARVTLTGTGLAHVSSISVDGVPASGIQVFSDTAVSAVLPPRSVGVHTIRVLTNLGAASFVIRYADAVTPLPGGTLSAGMGGTAALRNGGILAWGYNSEGEIGDGTTESPRRTPVAVGLSDVIAVSRGAFHTLALTADGQVYAWGYGAPGALGDGTSTSHSSPAVVPGLSNIVAIGAGHNFSVAVTASGRVYTWGDNAYGYLGDGSTTSRPSPVLVPGLTGVTSISVNNFHTLALRSDGTVWAWGSNNFGGLGIGTQSQAQTTPVQVPGLPRMTGVAAGVGYSLALSTTGRVYAWGANQNGQLGDGTTVNRTTPVVLTGIDDVVALAGSSDHSLGLTADGVVYAWGYNVLGTVVDGSNQSRTRPTIIGGLPRIAGIAAGDSRSHAITSDGRVYSWGANGDGQLGDGGVSDGGHPVKVVG